MKVHVIAGLRTKSTLGLRQLTRSASTYPLPPARTYPLPPARTYPLPPARTYPLPPARTYPLPPARTYPLPPARTEHKDNGEDVQISRQFLMVYFVEMCLYRGNTDGKRTAWCLVGRNISEDYNENIEKYNCE